MLRSVALNQDLDVSRHAQAIAAARRVHVPSVLDRASAQHIHALMEQQREWGLVSFLENRHRVIDAQAFEALSDDRRRPFFEMVHTTARSGFSYLFENIPLYDLWHTRVIPDHPLLPLVDFLRGEAFLDFARRLTGMGDIMFADAQATRFRAGHFLTSHDDDAHGKNRRAAYVLNLTPRWNPDWGGQLVFFDEAGNVTGGYTPAFNALNVFLIPVRHSVAYVTPFAEGPRYAITGWLRAGDDPGPG